MVETLASTVKQHRSKLPMAYANESHSSKCLARLKGSISALANYLVQVCIVSPLPPPPLSPLHPYEGLSNIC